MNFNVPQYIEVEDKLAFQLTIKQLGWLALGATGLFFLWQTGSGMALIFIGAPVALLFLAFAFYQPAGMTFFQFVINSIAYLFKPKVLIWYRNAQNKTQEVVKRTTKEKTKASINRYVKEKELKSSQDMADLLDTNSKI